MIKKIFFWKYWTTVAGAVWFASYITTQSFWDLGIAVGFITLAAIQEACRGRK